MAYREFDLLRAKRDFGLTTTEDHDLFSAVPEAPVSEPLRLTLAEHLPLAQGSGSDKARSELLIAPMLVELRRLHERRIGLFSGADFTVDEPRNLTGFCNFIVTRSPELYAITAPVLLFAEAKRENIASGLGQCLAGMVAAQRFNAREGSPIETVYGAVTTGTAWKFLALSGPNAAIDVPEYHISDPGRVLGILFPMTR